MGVETAMRLFLLLPLLVAACKGKSVPLGQGPERDARLIADVYTWSCEQQDTGSGEILEWEGVFAYDVILEYAPDQLVDRSLPASGCVATSEGFPRDAGAGAVDIPGVGTPEWSNGDFSGTIPWASTGFYETSVFDKQRSCQEADDLLGDGTLLASAGAFSGARAPAPGSLMEVELSGEVDEVTGITFGAEVTATWNSAGWSESWVQVRREKAGQALQTVTCATSGGSSFTLDDSVWAMLNEALEVDVTNLYVAVQNTDVLTMDDDQQIEVMTRSMSVAVVQD